MYFEFRSFSILPPSGLESLNQQSSLATFQLQSLLGKKIIENRKK